MKRKITICFLLSLIVMGTSSSCDNEECKGAVGDLFMSALETPFRAIQGDVGSIVCIIKNIGDVIVDCSNDHSDDELATPPAIGNVELRFSPSLEANFEDYSVLGNKDFLIRGLEANEVQRDTVLVDYDRVGYYALKVRLNSAESPISEASMDNNEEIVIIKVQ